MSTLELWLLGYLLNSVWQIPLIFAAGWLVARLAGRVDLRMEHRVWVCALLLEVTLPACHLRPAELLRQLWSLALQGWGATAGGADETRIAIGVGGASGNEVLRLSAVMLWGIAVAYGCCLLYFFGRLGWGLWKTSVMQRRLERVMLMDDAARSWERYARIFGIGAGKAKIAISSKIFGPVTVGVRQGMLLVPPGFLDNVGESDLDTVFAHEFAHMQRHDFAKNLLYELLTLPVAYHPLLWLTRSRIAETREMVCDAMAAEAVEGRERYARSLLRLASILANRAPARTLHAIGIFDANIFERRVMNLTRKHIEIKGARRFTIVAACVAVALVTCGTALALRMEMGAPAVSSATQAENPSTPKVSAAIMSGQRISGANPVYPPQAKADKLAGSVVLALIINKEGEPEDLHVKKGVRDDLDESALTAVQTWRWKPYLLNGNPTAVKTTVTVNYSLGN